MVTLTRILIIWILVWLLLLISRNAIQIFKKRVLASIEGRDVTRLEALSSVFQQAASFVIVGIAVLLTLDEMGFSITPLLATAGVAGIAVGFGAQNLVRDFIAGLFMLIEGQVSEGDYVEAVGKAGFVERVTLRHLRLRDEAGNVHFISNGSITTLTNSSRNYTYAVIDVTVPQDSDFQALTNDMQAVAEALRHDPEVGAAISGELIVDGIEKLEPATMVVRCRLLAGPAHHRNIRHLFLRRMKEKMDSRKADHGNLNDKPNAAM